MRHLKRTAKLGRTGEHRNAMLANLVCSLIARRRITTTLAKAKAARPVAEKVLTLAKSGTLHDRRLALARLHRPEAVKVLFGELAQMHRQRPGGYTRIVKLLPRPGDAAQMAMLEWVEGSAPEAAPGAAPALAAPAAAPSAPPASPPPAEEKK